MLEKLKYYKLLIGLGVFSQKALNLIKNKNFKNYLFVYFKVFLYISWDKFLLCLNKAFFLIANSNNILNFAYLFIDFKKTNVFLLDKFYNNLKLSTCFYVYDWTYGILSNFLTIYLPSYSYKCLELPVLVFLLDLIDQQYMVANELKKKIIKYRFSWN